MNGLYLKMFPEFLRVNFRIEAKADIVIPVVELDSQKTKGLSPQVDILNLNRSSLNVLEALCC